MPETREPTMAVTHDQVHAAFTALGLELPDWFVVKSIHITPDLVTIDRNHGQITTVLAITHPDPCEVCDLERPADPEGPARA